MWKGCTVAVHLTIKRRESVLIMMNERREKGTSVWWKESTEDDMRVNFTSQNDEVRGKRTASP
jgi:hypothetical protein